MKKVIHLILTITAVIIFTGCPLAAPNVDNTITEFGFKDVSPVTVEITGAAIRVAVPYETKLSALSATFTTSGVRVTVDDVEQVSGTTFELPPVL